MIQEYDQIENLENKVKSICKGSHSFNYLNSIFQEMRNKNLQNTKIFYEFLITEYNN